VEGCQSTNGENNEEEKSKKLDNQLHNCNKLTVKSVSYEIYE